MAETKNTKPTRVDPTAMLRELADTDRRIDNMKYLLVFKERRRLELIAMLQGVLGRTAADHRFIDFDARRDPRTDHWCIMCQKDLDPAATSLEVRLILIDNGAQPHALRASDEVLLNLGVLSVEGDDQGRAPIGADCARKLGREWVLTRNARLKSRSR